GQLLALGVQQVALESDRHWPVGEILHTAYFQSSVLRVLDCVALTVAALWLRRRTESRAGWATLAGLTILLAVTAAAISHAAARLQYEGFLLALDAVHQYAASVWVGGLMHLTVVVAGSRDRPWQAVLLQRFSSMALGAVVVLVAGGIGPPAGLLRGPHSGRGTPYGVRV